jgi:hypothetical protein
VFSRPVWRRRHRIAERGALPLFIKGLHLCDAAIHEQFYSRDSSDARDHGLDDLIGYAEPAERNSIGNQFLLLFADF